MINLAGVSNCDVTMEAELKEAGIPIVRLPCTVNTEVPYTLFGELNGWCFRRSWYYWVAESRPGAPLPFSLADPLHEQHGSDVRVSGHCLAPAPREWYKHPWFLGVSLYHVDSQAGLNALARSIVKTVE